jgi:serine protease inhibitor
MPDEAALMTAARAAATAAGASGADMYRLLATEGANTVFSPVSVTSALGMACCGARGQTAAELARALHLNGSADAAMDGTSARYCPTDVRVIEGSAKCGDLDG